MAAGEWDRGYNLRAWLHFVRDGVVAMSLLKSALLLHRLISNFFTKFDDGINNRFRSWRRIGQINIHRINLAMPQTTVGELALNILPVIGQVPIAITDLGAGICS